VKYGALMVYLTYWYDLFSLTVVEQAFFHSLSECSFAFEYGIVATVQACNATASKSEFKFSFSGLLLIGNLSWSC
jgi:hypothetical protein